MNKLRVLFAGTPDFARVALEALVESGTWPEAVLTQPDRRAGRGKKLQQSPVKRYAEEQGIEVLQPPSLRDEQVVAELRAYEPDLLIVAAYGLILPQSVLDIPKHGCLNIHASLLPSWRGAAPIQAAILNGDEETGISLMSMTAGLDCGPVYSMEAIDIADDETAGELHDRLAALGGEMLVRDLASIVDGTLQAEAQNNDAASYAGKISSSDAQLDWHESATMLIRKVRAYNPVPGAWFNVGQERIKCWSARRIDGSHAGLAPGSVLSSSEAGLVVTCGSGAVALDELQRPGKKRLPAHIVAEQLGLTNQSLIAG